MPWIKDLIHSGYVVKCKITTAMPLCNPLDFYVNTVEQYTTSFPLFVCIVCVWAYTINWWMNETGFDFFFPIFFAGGTVPEEKQEDAGHFDPLCHSHCSYYYSFWNKVLILHSSSFCFLSGCLLCICVDLDSVSVLPKTKMTAFHTHQETKIKKSSGSLRSCALGCKSLF